MLARFLLVVPIALAFAACTASSADGGSEVTADDLEAMAIPGVDDTALDRSVDPCTDFYAFACGGWIASRPADTKNELRSFTQLQKDQRALLGQIIDAVRTSPDTDAERKAGAFVSSCLADPDPGQTTAFLAGFRQEIEAATTPEALATVLARMHRRGLDPFFSFSPQVDTEIQGRHGSATVIPGGFDWFTEYDSDEPKAERIVTLTNAILAGEPSLGNDEATRLATAAVSIEAQLYLAGAEIDPQETPHPIGRPGLAAAMPDVPWDAYFQALGRSDLGNFDVNGLTFLATVDGIFASASASSGGAGDIQAYLVARWFEAMTREIAAVPAEKRDYCADQLVGSMADAIEPRFLLLAGVDGKAKAKAKALLDQLMTSFGATLDQGDSFLDVPTRIEAKTKLGKIKAAVATSKNLDDFGDLELGVSDPFLVNSIRVRERSFDHALAQVGKSLPLLHVDLPAPIINATYDTALNKINVPGGILGGYFFSPKAPALANFSALGAVLGHELTHGFDNHGRHIDGDGRLRDWFSPAVEQEFQERAQCLIDQYDAYTLDGVADPHTGVIPAHVSGRLTIAENIADNGGIKTAYHASKVEGRETPTVSGFSPAQQFFVGYAQLWCAKTAPDVASQELASDIHAPPRARVNIPLANFDAFGAAFQCASGTAMAPAQRCGVW